MQGNSPDGFYYNNLPSRYFILTQRMIEVNFPLQPPTFFRGGSRELELIYLSNKKGL